MAKIKMDGLIEAVRYAPDGKIDLVRAYERRGATFSDVILIDRANLVNRLKNGQRFVTGMRKEFLGSTFETAKAVQLTSDGGFITTAQPGNHVKSNPSPMPIKHDLLEEVPDL